MPYRNTPPILASTAGGGETGAEAKPGTAVGAAGTGAGAGADVDGAGAGAGAGAGCAGD
tara:strand:- start:401 stop:577 length:177 start_codon:yes stop_codon:yes gene_type:complete